MAEPIGESPVAVRSYAGPMTHSTSSLADRAPRGTLTKGRLGPDRHVPGSIPRPEYMFHDGPERVTASDVKDAETVERIRRAGRVAARALAEAAGAIAPGVTTDELDRIAHEYMCDHGAYPSCLGYMGFPKSICTSVNEVICHGIPDSTVLREGDLINLDVTAYLDGVHGDTNATFPVGRVDPESAALIERTRTAMERGIKAVRPGREVNVIGRVIEKYARRFDYGVVRDYTGHGVGEAFHSGLIIPHYDAAPLYADVMEVGMVFTIEPMLTLGTEEWTQWGDGWTVVTKDRSRTAQFEHTLVVTENGAEVLTLPEVPRTSPNSPKLSSRFPRSPPDVPGAPGRPSRSLKGRSSRCAVRPWKNDEAHPVYIPPQDDARRTDAPHHPTVPEVPYGTSIQSAA